MIIKQLKLVTAVAALCAVAAATSGCGGDGSSEASAATKGPLRWAKTPLVFAPGTLPKDRILYGSIRNTTDRTVHLNIEDLRTIDARGYDSAVFGRFVASFTHRLQPYNKKTTGQLPERTRINTGLATNIPPNGTRPITISWHQYNELREAKTISYGSGTLAIPKPNLKRDAQ